MRFNPGQSARCTVTPRPTVAYPAMDSGFTGAQQRAKLVGKSSTPPSTTGERELLRTVAFLRGGAGAGAAGAAAGAAFPDSSSIFRNHARTFDRDRGLVRNPCVSDSQSRLGCGYLCVMISTISPFASA